MQSRKRRSSKPLSLNSVDSKSRKFKSSDTSSIFPKIPKKPDEYIHDIESEEESYEESAYYDSETESYAIQKTATANNTNRQERKIVKNLESLYIEDKKSKNYKTKLTEKANAKAKGKSQSKKFFHKINSRGKKTASKDVGLLPCREKEQDHIHNYVKKGLDTNGSYSTLYISGMPGTGKTACVTNILNKLSHEADKNLNPHFNKLFINGMKLSNPNNVFKVIYDFIFNDSRSVSVQKCISILDNFFRNRREFDTKSILNDSTNPHLVLIIDEIDCLINKKQILLYNIFNWTTYPHSKLIIISISNTMDLPDKLLPKISSRIGNNRLIFKPYQKDELVKILSVKIENFELFSEDAIKFCSMKVAAVNGDLRRILHICCRAKEIYDADHNKKDKKIDKCYIMYAIDDLFDAKVKLVIKNLKFFEKLCLAGVLFEKKLQMNSTSNRISVNKVYDRMRYFYAKTYNVSQACPVTYEEFMMIIYNLAKIQIICLNENDTTNFTSSDVNIKFEIDEFTSAIGDDEKFKEIIKEIS